MDTMTRTLDYWAARLAQNARLVTMRNDPAHVGSIRRVTTGGVWVRWNAGERATVQHPGDLRIAGPYDGLSSCDLWNIG